MTIDHQAAYEKALVAYLKGVLDDDVTVRRGFPPRGEPLNPEGKAAVVAVTTGDPEITPLIGVREVDETGTGASKQYTWKLAISEFPVQVDIFTTHRAVRDLQKQIVYAALHNDLPSSANLLLTSDEYFGRPSKTMVTGKVTVDDSTASQDGMWRAGWIGDVITDICVQSAPGVTRDIAMIGLDVSTELSNLTIAEPRVSVP